MNGILQSKARLGIWAWVGYLACSSCGSPSDTPTMNRGNQPEAGATIDATSPPDKSVLEPSWHPDGKVRAGLQYTGAIAYVREK